MVAPLYSRPAGGRATAAAGTNAAAGATSILLNSTLTGINAQLASAIWLFRPQDAVTTHAAFNTGYWRDGASIFYTFYGAGFFDNTTAFTGLSIFPSAGTITGVIRIYGVQDV